MTVVEDGELKTREVPLRNALNEVLRGEYVKDLRRVSRVGTKCWLMKVRVSVLTLPHPRFHRHVGEFAGHTFDLRAIYLARGI